MVVIHHYYSLGSKLSIACTIQPTPTISTNRIIPPTVSPKQAPKNSPAKAATTIITTEHIVLPIIYPPILPFQL